MRFFFAGMFALCRKELKMILKDPRSRMILVMPIIVQSLLFGYAVSFDLNDVPFAILDEDNSVLSRELARRFDASPTFRRAAVIRNAADEYGARGVRFNAIRPGFISTEIMEGISREGSLIDYGVDQAIVKKSGAWYTYDGEQLGQGKENARNFLLKNPDIAADIETKILQKLGIGQPKSDATAPVADLAERRPA